MNNKQQQLRLQAVQHYLNNGDSLRKTAQKFHVYYPTVFKWVKLYKEQGEQRLLSTYKRPWNRIKKELEEKIALLKEKDPSLTVRKAKKVLERKGIKISIKGIWGVWKRYGYVGFKKENMTNEFIEYCPWTIEARKKFELAKKMFDKGNIKKSARILNSIPLLPKNELILEIPDSLLNLRRKIEKMACLFGRITLHRYLRKTESLYKKLKRKNLYYSVLRVGIMGVMALEWSGEPEKELEKIEELKKIVYKMNVIKPGELDRHKEQTGSYILFEPRFTLLVSEGIACASLSKIKRGYEIASTCRKLLRRWKKPSPHFVENLGILYAHLEDYREAEYWILKSLDRVDEGTKKKLNSYLAVIYLNSGRYKKATHILKYAELGEWAHHSWILIFRSSLFLTKGMPQKAMSLATEALPLSRKEELNRAIFYASFSEACSYCSIDEKVKARRILKRILPFLEKHKLRREASILEILLSQTPSSRSRSANSYFPFPNPQLNKDFFPTVKLALFVRNGDYFKALSYAKKKYLMTYFYRYIFFSPEIVKALLEKGKPTYLPKAILNLPVFNKETSVYNIKFLGDFIIHKNQKYLRTKLQPKDKAFLIHLALKAGEPGMKISLEALYRDFWQNSRNPSRNLSHLLVRIKKVLKIPSYLIEISAKKDNPVLINKGLYFTTDYNEFEQALMQAQALLRVGEWDFAKKEYLRTFKLFRDEPFKKMYDNWSDSVRRVILNKYESEFINFAKECIAHKDYKIARDNLEKVEKVIRYSEEIDKIKEYLGG